MARATAARVPRRSSSRSSRSRCTSSMTRALSSPRRIIDQLSLSVSLENIRWTKQSVIGDCRGMPEHAASMTTVMPPAPDTARSPATAQRGSRTTVTAAGKPGRHPRLAILLFPAAGAPGAALLRLGLAAVVLLALTRPRVRGWRRVQWQAVLLYGMSIAGTNAFFYAALARLPLGTAVTIQFLGPLSLSAALSRRMRDLGWVLLAVTGVAILGLAESRHVSGGSLSLTGVAFALVSAVFWAMYIVTGARASAAVPGRGGLAVAMTAGTLVLMPFGARGAWHITGQPHLMLLAFGMAMMASVVPYSLELAAMRRAPKRVFGILLSLEPAVATVAGWLLLGQHAAPAALAAIVTV